MILKWLIAFLAFKWNAIMGPTGRSWQCGMSVARIRCSQLSSCTKSKTNYYWYFVQEAYIIYGTLLTSDDGASDVKIDEIRVRTWADYRLRCFVIPSFDPIVPHSPQTRYRLPYDASLCYAPFASFIRTIPKWHTYTTTSRNYYNDPIWLTDNECNWCNQIVWQIIIHHLAVDKVCDVWQTHEFRTYKFQLPYRLQIDRVTRQKWKKKNVPPKSRETTNWVHAECLQTARW